MKAKAIFICLGGSAGIEYTYSSDSRACLEEALDFASPFYKQEDLALHAAEWKDVEYLFSTWGMPELGEEQLKEFFPALKAIFYAAGSVQAFARPFLKRGVRVFTANEALSIPVIEFAAAQIYLANKGFFQAARLYHEASWEEAKKFSGGVPGNEGIAIGIIGAGRIGRGLIERLRGSRLAINVFDPFLNGDDAEKMRVKKVETLDELFSASFIISNHLANNEQTRGMLQYRHFTLMHDYGVFINTGRGAQVDEEGLVRAFTEKPTRTALLDVTWPEPVQPGHAFYGMKNIIISPHIAGAINNECVWLGEYIVEEFRRLGAGEALRSEVTEKMLLTMA
ncbi:MAG: hypothetical protein LBG95_08670 [Treponema sp.]|jgi:phosphoglycerate dehydrogenase-like enzyme|nr:hypothetical protein [Treponema sp.]